MAEVFGVVAGVIQLADVALRVSREVYGFLAAVKNADKDIKALRDTLRDVESNVRSLRRYVAEFQKSKCATEEFEVLSEAITRSFSGFHEDILALKQTLPPKPTPSLAEKTKWTYKQRRIKEITERLRSRQVDLTTALSIIGRLHDLRAREDAATITRLQTLSTSALDKQAENLERSVRANEQSHAELIEQTRRISTQIGALQNEAQLGHLRQRRQAQDMHVIKKSLRTLPTPVRIGSKAVKSEPRWAQGQISPQPLGLTSSPGPGHKAAVSEICSTTTFSAAHTDLAAKIIRNELRSSLGAMIEQAHITSESRYEIITQKIDALIEQVSSSYGERAFASRSASPEPDSMRCAIDHDICDEKQPLQQTEIVPRSSDSEARVTTYTYHQAWSKFWRIGSILIQITRRTHRRASNPISASDLTIRVQFWPNQTLIQLPSIAVSYSTAPNQDGFYQLAPMMCVIPIVSYKHYIWKVIYNDHLPQLCQMLENGEAHLHAQNEAGETMLHNAVFHSSLKISQFLVTQGLSWHAKNGKNQTPIDYAIMLLFVYKVPEKNPTSTLELAHTPKLDLDQLWYNNQAWGFLSHAFHDSKHVLTRHEYIVKNFQDGWHHICYTLVDDWSYPTKGSVLINLMLQRGLNPNLGVGRINTTTTLLSRALYSLHDTKVKLQVAEAGERAYLEQGRQFYSFPELRPTIAEQENGDWKPWCIIAALIRGGADIYHILPSTFDKAGSWLDLESMWNYVTGLDVILEWEMALEECGLDYDDVILEDVRQRKQAFRLRGANRTGFDDTVLELPSFSGLRCRSCRRKICEHAQHWDFSHEYRLVGVLRIDRLK